MALDLNFDTCNSYMYCDSLFLLKCFMNVSFFCSNFRNKDNALLTLLLISYSFVVVYILYIPTVNMYLIKFSL